MAEKTYSLAEVTDLMRGAIEHRATSVSYTHLYIEKSFQHLYSICRFAVEKEKSLEKILPKFYYSFCLISL